jgi:hypothetical protein
LLNEIHVEGAFIVRHSDSDNSVFVISLFINQKACHYRLKRNGRLFLVGNDNFENLEQLVEHFTHTPFVHGITLNTICLKKIDNIQLSDDYNKGSECYMDFANIHEKKIVTAIQSFSGNMTK